MNRHSSPFLLDGQEGVGVCGDWFTPAPGISGTLYCHIPMSLFSSSETILIQLLYSYKTILRYLTLIYSFLL